MAPATAAAATASATTMRQVDGFGTRRRVTGVRRQRHDGPTDYNRRMQVASRRDGTNAGFHADRGAGRYRDPRHSRGARRSRACSSGPTKRASSPHGATSRRCSRRSSSIASTISAIPRPNRDSRALTARPTLPPLPPNWKQNGYLDRLPKDPWGNPTVPQSGLRGEIDVYSFGRGRPAGRHRYRCRRRIGTSDATSAVPEGSRWSRSGRRGRHRNRRRHRHRQPRRRRPPHDRARSAASRRRARARRRAGAVEERDAGRLGRRRHLPFLAPWRDGRWIAIDDDDVLAARALPADLTVKLASFAGAPVPRTRSFRSGPAGATNPTHSCSPPPYGPGRHRRSAEPRAVAAYAVSR